jgi:hypothetical protein
MDRFNELEYFILFFYRDSIVTCLEVVYEYESTLVILINVIFLINMKFPVKYH